MKAQAYYWLHMVPFIVVMGLAVILLVVSALLSFVPGKRGSWWPVFITGLFGALLFVSPPFRMLSHSIRIGDYQWSRWSQMGAALVPDHLRLETISYAWLPEFLAGFLVFALARMLYNWVLRR